ncbi:MAG TPA: sugar ABC transporter ATP-binding protein [Jatrophihabitans sp.]|nr:sugar ABC transporter ATP-binding protein [Jatrophihabitans sp.]
MTVSDVPPLLTVRGLTKSFGGALALDDVDLTVLPGEVHGLLGENGSGKSTLIKILAGYHAPDAGELSVNGTDAPLPLPPGQSRALGFEFVHQDLGLVPGLSVTENLFMGEIAAARKRFFVSWSRNERRAREIFKRYGLRLDPSVAVDDIRPVDRALLAIVRALEGLRTSADERPTLLVLDEPTVFLPAHEVALLFNFVRQIAASGSSVLFVSHDLDEVREITDRITVLRDGRRAGTVSTAATSPKDLVRLIIGHDLEDMLPGGAHLEVAKTPVLLQVRQLATPMLRGISFDLHAGEVLGLTGLVGSGYEDVVYALFGAISADGGELRIGEKHIPLAALDPHAAMRHGIALVPGDRQRNGSIPSLTAAENVSLLVLDKYFRTGLLRQRELDRDVRAAMTSYDVRPPRPELDYGAFSGGNQQKAMMAKWQQVVPSVLLLHEPTQGVDVGARQQIWSMIRGSGAASNGTICASSDYEQLAAICDRVGVIARGELVGFLTGDEVTKERITDFCLRSSAGVAATVSTPIEGLGSFDVSAKGQTE